MKPITPRVSCKQQLLPAIPAAPKGNEWVEWLPPSPAQVNGSARLSAKAATWIVELLGYTRKVNELRAVEHNCLDEAEKKGLIQQ